MLKNPVTLIPRTIWLDPVISLLIVIGIVIGTWSLLRDSLRLALSAVPAHIEVIVVEPICANVLASRISRSAYLGHEYNRGCLDRPFGNARRIPR
ncbi:hypothetical protein [Methylobacter tundripaludum]|uniref:hypothetical protein n=1 Tax=Methylobacter tundripaludum TaxID=173365 RepID=UPI00190F1347|nr:hypothetical protein [Methylobacter tundripaludum]